MSELTDRLRGEARALRRRVLQVSFRSRCGHIGSALSCVELLVGVFSTLRFSEEDANRDHFILSKGHACVPYYCCLERAGLMPSEHVEHFGEDGGLLGHHPDRMPKYGIDTGTGSLGHGLGIGAGIALAGQRTKASSRTFVLMSDGEQGEGSVWEAACFAAHHHLDSLVALIDVNRIQALGRTSEILSVEPLHDRYRSFGWGVRRINGHDMDQIVSSLANVPFDEGRPSVIVADTVKGKGVSFMEDNLLWHYRCPDAAEMTAALMEIDEEQCVPR